MTVYFKIIASSLMCLMMYMVLNKYSKDFSLLLSIAACTMILVVCISYIGPIMQFLNKLEVIGQLNSDTIKVLFRSVGVGILAEITTMLCNDAGNSSLAKTITLSSSIVILYMCLPLFEGMIDVISGILGEI